MYPIGKTKPKLHKAIHFPLDAEGIQPGGGDTTAPLYSSSDVDEATPTVIELTFNEVINSPGADYTLGFTVTVNGTESVISAGARQTNQAVINLTIADRVLVGDTVTVAYDSSVGDIEDQAPTPNALATFSAETVTNSATSSPPDFQVFAKGRYASDNTLGIDPVFGTGSSSFSRAGTPLAQDHRGVYLPVSANTVRRVGLHQVGYDYFSASADSYSTHSRSGTEIISTPHSSAIDITGDIDIRVKVDFTDQAVGGNLALASKLDAAGNECWIFYFNSSNQKLYFGWWESTIYKGATASSVVPVGEGHPIWLRATLDVSTGDYDYYYSGDETTWTSLGSPSISASTSIDSQATANLEVGRFGSGTSPFYGNIYEAKIYNGIGGTLAAHYDASDWVSGTTFTSASTGETWTLAGSVPITSDDNPLYPTTTTTAGSYEITRAAQYTNWAANTAYALGDRVYPESYSNIVVNPDEDYYFECTTAGTSHATTEPTWDTTTIDSSTTSDGTVTWTYKGLATYKGILLEPAQTNSLDYSRDLSNAAWAKTNSTATYDQTGIDGTANSASLLVDDSSTGTGIVLVDDGITVTSGQSNVLKVIAKASGLNWCALQARNLDATSTCYFDLANVAVGTATNCTANIANLGNGWVVCQIEFSSTTDVSGNVRVYVCDADNDADVALDGTSSIIVGNIELIKNTTKEATLYSSPIFTSGASASRVTELGALSYNIANYTDDASSALVDLVYLNAPAADSGILSVNGGQADYISHDGTGFNSDDGTNVATIAQAITAGDLYRIAQRQTTTKQQMSEGGANGTEGNYDNARTATALTVIEGTGALVKNALIINSDLGITDLNTLTETD